MDRIRFVWELLTANGEAAHLGDSPRQELVDLVTGEPRRALDVGCHRGALGAALKQRFPGLHCTGIELNPVTAEVARERLDRVVTADVETLDLETQPELAEPFDALFLSDVLAGLRDPWRTLMRLSGLLEPDARIYASVPNARNYRVISELVKGHWTYQPSGLLDVTQLRFFTLSECRRMFAETGYRVEAVGAVRDPRVQLDGPFRAPVTIMDKWFALHDVDAQMAMELSTQRFLFVLSRVSSASGK